jgi:phosphate:Na+ symporter
MTSISIFAGMHKALRFTRISFLHFALFILSLSSVQGLRAQDSTIDITSVVQEVELIEFNNLFTQNVGSESAKLYWNSIRGSESIMLRYKAKSDESFDIIELDQKAIHLELQNLQERTDYIWQLGAKTATTTLWSKEQKFTTEEGYSWYSILILIGALGFFIYGMKIMSEGIQRFAGDKMRQILGVMTTNRFAGLFTGFLTTSLIQSSSATTVMIVSFVNAGLLSLRQAIGVIMGANIGTTVTAVMVTFLGFSKFSIASYSLPIIAIGFPLLFMKGDRTRSFGEFLIGFGLLFMGLDALKNAVPGLDSGIMMYLEPLTGMGVFSTLLFVGIGTIITVIIQSSSAAMTLTLVLCGKGLPFELAAAIVLGENIGTTITANLAAMIGNVHAKRAARAHLMFNLFGVVWMIVVFPFFLNGIDSYIGSTSLRSPLAADAEPQAIQWALTLFHIAFNIVNSLILIWFVDFIAKTAVRMVPSRGEDDEFRLEYIGRGILSTPELSVLEARKELSKFGAIIRKMNGFARSLIFEKDDKKKSKLNARIGKYEDIADRLQVEVDTYLAKIGEGELSDRSIRDVRAMLSISGDLERVSDLYYQFSKIFQNKEKKKIWFTPEQRTGLDHMFLLLDNASIEMISNLDKLNEPDLKPARLCEKTINEHHDKLKKKHLNKIGKKDYNIEGGMVYTEMVGLTEKVGDHMYEVSEALTGENTDS